MEINLIFADTLTVLGHGEVLREALWRGDSGLKPAREVFPTWFPEQETHVGAFPDLPENEPRLPVLFARAKATIIPSAASACDFIVGASSLGDFAGDLPGRPINQMQAVMGDLFPDLPPDRHLVVSSACSSGTDAVGTAAMLIRGGMARTVGVLAFDSLEPGKLSQHLALGTQTLDRARPFDVNRDGTSFGEGVAFVILSAAPDNLGLKPLARFAGHGMSCDALDLTAPDASGVWPSAAISRALTAAGNPHKRIGYINAHGSGTPLNDRAECLALTKVFGRNAANIPVSSTKGAVGHQLGAVGLTELVFTAWALESGTIPPTAGLVNPDPEISLNLPREAFAPIGGIQAALSVTFGFGGVNAAVVLEGVSS